MDNKKFPDRNSWFLGFFGLLSCYWHFRYSSDLNFRVTSMSTFSNCTDNKQTRPDTKRQKKDMTQIHTHNQRDGDRTSHKQRVDITFWTPCTISSERRQIALLVTALHNSPARFPKDFKTFRIAFLSKFSVLRQICPRFCTNVRWFHSVITNVFHKFMSSRQDDVESLIDIRNFTRYILHDCHRK